MSHDNSQVLKASIHAFNKLKANHIMAGVRGAAVKMLEDALEMRRGWLGFTGNLPTSYSAGVYDFNGNLEIVYAEDVNSEYSLSSVRRPKVGRGESAVLDVPWEGTPRSVRGEADLKTRYGVELVHMFLNGYKPKKLPCIVMCTGAEYSKYLQDSREGAVVLEVPSNIKNMVQASFTEVPFNARNMITR